MKLTTIGGKARNSEFQGYQYGLIEHEEMGDKNRQGMILM